MEKKLNLTIVVLSLLLSSLFVHSGVQQGPPKDNRQQDQDHQDQEADEIEKIKSTGRQLFMKGKLMSNQKIVEGLTTKNYEMIRLGADAVTALTKGEHWFVLDTPEYKSYSEDMKAAATRLKEAAAKENIEAATLRYFELTLNCIDCHNYIEKQQY
jgi:hypothetical protein